MTAAKITVRLLTMTVAGTCLIALSLQNARAGFEWTPPAKTEPVAPTKNEGPVVAPVPVSPVEPGLLTPEPSEETSIQIGPKPVEQAVTPISSTPIQDLPVPGMKTLPAPVAPQPTKTSLETSPVANKAEAAQASVPNINERPSLAPAPVQAPAPQSYPPRIPPSVKAEEVKPTPPSESVKPPQPVNETKEEPKKEPKEEIIWTQSQADKPAILEGFGKEIPLAMALRQIVPPNYAYLFGENVSAGQKISWQGGKPWQDVLNETMAKYNLRASVDNNVITIHNLNSPVKASVEVKAAQSPVIQPPAAPAKLDTPEAPEVKDTVTKPAEVKSSEPKPLPPAPLQKPEKSSANIFVQPESVTPPKIARTPSAQDIQPAAIPAEKQKAIPQPSPAPAKQKQPKELPLPPAEGLMTLPQDDLSASDAQKREAAEMRAAEIAAPPPVPASLPASENQAPDKPPVVDINAKRKWEATAGKSLRETLETWSKTAGAELEWMTPYDYPVNHAFKFQGRFDEAVDSLLSLYAKEKQRPRGRLYPNLPSGPSVLMIN